MARMDSASSTWPQPLGLVLPSASSQSQGPPMAQHPRPIALTSRLLRPNRRLNIRLPMFVIPEQTHLICGAHSIPIVRYSWINASERLAVEDQEHSLVYDRGEAADQDRVDGFDL